MSLKKIKIFLTNQNFMKFLILSEISELKLKNDENYIVFEKFHEDFYSKK